MKTTTFPRRQERGFSLVELMVSVVIGMLALLFATKLFATSEQNKEASIGASDSMQNGMQALFTISRDAGQAGWGLNDPLIGGCDTKFADTKDFALPTTSRSDQADAIAPLAAALIQSNGDKPDSITLFSGNSITGTGMVGLATDYDGVAGTIKVDRLAMGFAKNDAILVVPEGNDGFAVKCAIGELSADPAMVAGVQTLTLGATGTRFNRVGGLGEKYKVGSARLFNLGPARGVAFHTWSLNGSFLQLRATDLAGAEAKPQAVIDNVVSLKAQYGFNTGAFNPEAGMQISQWSSTMMNADGDTVTGGPGDYQRIAALRIAVVARSRQPERPKSGTCTATTDDISVFTSAQPKGVAAVPVKVDVAVAGDTVDWHCYRYRVFETIVPIRNLAWRPTAS